MVNLDHFLLNFLILYDSGKDPIFNPYKCPNYDVRCSLDNALDIPVTTVYTPAACGRLNGWKKNTFLIFFSKLFHKRILVNNCEKWHINYCYYYFLLILILPSQDKNASKISLTVEPGLWSHRIQHHRMLPVISWPIVKILQ